jgi:SAM-dependent methyltransferase
MSRQQQSACADPVAAPALDWACPNCKNTLAADYAGGFTCTGPSCARKYPIVDGVPILINERRSIFRISDFEHNAATTIDWKHREHRKSARNPLRVAARLLSDHAPTLSVNLHGFNAHETVRRILAERPAARILVLGCGDVRFDVPPPARIMYSDVAIGPITDIVCDATDIPSQNETLDAVIAATVLPYVADAERAVAEIVRVLKPDGFVYTSVPFMQQIVLGKYDFTRYTYAGHRRLMRHFEAIERGMSGGPAMVLLWTIHFFFESFFESHKARIAARLTCRYLFFWIKYFDHILVKKRGSYDGAAGFVFFGRKRDRELSDREILESHVGLRPF